MPSPCCTRLSCWAQMFHTNTNLLFFCFVLLLLFCWARGLCILSKCAVCVKLCATTSELLFCFSAPQSVLNDSQRSKHRKPKVKRRKWCTGLNNGTETGNKNPLMNNIINQTLFTLTYECAMHTFWSQSNLKVIWWCHWSGVTQWIMLLIDQYVTFCDAALCFHAECSVLAS